MIIWLAFSNEPVRGRLVGAAVGAVVGPPVGVGLKSTQSSVEPELVAIILKVTVANVPEPEKPLDDEAVKISCPGVDVSVETVVNVLPGVVEIYCKTSDLYVMPITAELIVCPSVSTLIVKSAFDPRVKVPEGAVKSYLTAKTGFA